MVNDSQSSDAGPMPTLADTMAIDLFCGAGGLAFGLKSAGLSVAAGVDLDPACRFPLETNTGAAFHERDVTDVTADELERWYGPARFFAYLEEVVGAFDAYVDASKYLRPDLRALRTDTGLVGDRRSGRRSPAIPLLTRRKREC